MKNTTPTHRPQTAVSPEKKTQTARFQELHEAREALHDHLRHNARAADWLLSRARAALNGENRNEAKAYFTKGHPSRGSVAACAEASDAADRPATLRALCGKRALYEECAAWLRDSAAEAGEAAATGAFWAKFNILEDAYVQIRKRIVAEHLGLVRFVLNKFPNKALPEEDLLQEGACALQKAVEGYDIQSGNLFSTYAVRVIRGSLTRACENSSKVIRVPSYQWTEVRRYSAKAGELEKVYERRPTPGEVAAALKESPQWAGQMTGLVEYPLSIDARVSGELTLGDTLVAPESGLPWGASSGYEELFERYRDGLDFLEREVVAGLMEGVSVEDIAGRLGVSASTLKGAMETARQKIAGRREQAA